MLFNNLDWMNYSITIVPTLDFIMELDCIKVITHEHRVVTLEQLVINFNNLDYIVVALGQQELVAQFGLLILPKYFLYYYLLQNFMNLVMLVQLHQSYLADSIVMEQMDQFVDFHIHNQWVSY